MEEVICPQCKKPSYTAARHEPPPCPYCGLSFYEKERKMKKTILAIDDDPAILGLMLNILTIQGYEVKTARNGIEALKMIDSTQYDLIISDINMPVMDGIEFYRKLVNKSPSMKERIIFVTGNVKPNTEKFIRETGARWFPKPFNITDFLEAINNLGKYKSIQP
jgi:CheY-like chemotaxis protein